MGIIPANWTERLLLKLCLVRFSGGSTSVPLHISLASFPTSFPIVICWHCGFVSFLDCEHFWDRDHVLINFAMEISLLTLFYWKVVYKYCTALLELSWYNLLKAKNVSPDFYKMLQGLPMDHCTLHQQPFCKLQPINLQSSDHSHSSGGVVLGRYKNRWVSGEPTHMVWWVAFDLLDYRLPMILHRADLKLHWPQCER